MRDAAPRQGSPIGFAGETVKKPHRLPAVEADCGMLQDPSVFGDADTVVSVDDPWDRGFIPIGRDNDLIAMTRRLSQNSEKEPKPTR